MKLATLAGYARKPWFLAPVSFGSGAALATATLGIPNLWSAEAAGWASAFATMAAVIVALGVGVLPELNRQREAEKRAFAQLHITISSIETQLVHLGRAIVVCRSDALGAGLRKDVSREMQEFNPEVVTVTLTFAKQLNDASFKAAAACLMDMNRVQSMMRSFNAVPDQRTLDQPRLILDILVRAYASMDVARSAFSNQIGSKAADIPMMPPELKEMV